MGSSTLNLLDYKGKFVIRQVREKTMARLTFDGGLNKKTKICHKNFHER